MAKASRSRRIRSSIPKCKADGSYAEKQCYGSTDQCWCVESIYGSEILNTRKDPGKGQLTCGIDIFNILLL